VPQQVQHIRQSPTMMSSSFQTGGIRPLALVIMLLISFLSHDQTFQPPQLLVPLQSQHGLELMTWYPLSSSAVPTPIKLTHVAGARSGIASLLRYHGQKFTETFKLYAAAKHSIAAEHEELKQHTASEGASMKLGSSQNHAHAAAQLAF